MRYLDPKNDVVFKKIFGGHPHLLKSFLNELLPFTDESQKIVSLEYLPHELVPEIPVLKNTIVDVRCTDQLGRIFVVEMQMIWTNAFMQRVLFNASKAYVRQLEKHKQYNLLKPVYGLSIVNDIFDQSDEFYHHYKIVNIENTDKVLNGLQFVFIELPKFVPDKIRDKKMAVLWLRFMKEVGEEIEKVSDDLLQNEFIKQAVEISLESAYNKSELETYDKYWDYVRVEKTLRDEAYLTGLTKGEQQGMEKGMVKGIEKGMEQGMEQGMEKGMEKGMEQVAKKMLSDNESIDKIIKFTGLSAEQIEKLK